MNTKEASVYLSKTYGVAVQPEVVSRWLNKGYIRGCLENRRWVLTEECLDEAISSRNIPRQVGRKSSLSKEDREQIREMFDHKKWSQKKIAKHFGISVSYVSKIVRGLR